MKTVIGRDKHMRNDRCISIVPIVFEVDEKFKAFVPDPKSGSDEDI